MLASLAFSSLALPTISNNNIFGNNNQIIVNGVSTMEPDPTPALTDPYCSLSEEPAVLDVFPPAGSPTWLDPIDKPGLTGYSPDVFGLSGPVLIGREAYPSGAHLCTQAKGFTDAMGASGYGYPVPRELVANGEKFMDKFIPFKAATAALAEGTEKTIRQTMIDATETLMLIFRSKEVKSLNLVGTKYYANLLFSTGPSDIDTVEANKRLYPLVPKFVAAVEKLVNLRATLPDNTLSPYFGDTGAGSILLQYSSIVVSSFNHAVGALTALPQTGYTPEAASAWREIYTNDYLDKKLGDDVMQIVPSLTYGLGTGPSGQVQPKNFYICSVALRMWEFMASIEAYGTKFVCTAPGAQILQAFSDMFTYEIELEASTAASTCNKPLQWSTDLMATIVYQIGISQELANGKYGTPFLSPENTRILSLYVDEIACIHLARINSLAPCKAAGKVYNGVPTAFRGDMMMLDFADQAGPFAKNGTLMELGIATVDEVCNVYKKEKEDTCGTVTLNRCPHTPLDKLAGINKCKDYNQLFAGLPSVMNSCKNYATFVTNYDPQYDNGCGFELTFGSTAKYVNYDTRVRDVCPEQCNTVPEDC